MQSPSLTLIVAATISNGIGATGRLPWRLSKEMAYFAQMTSHVPEGSSLRNAVIMGRKTWESIPLKFRPLKNRINVVVSRDASSLTDSGVIKAGNLEEACAYTNPELHRRFLIGGAQMYAHALASTSLQYSLDRILLTRILEPEFEECDVFLPEFRQQDGGGLAIWRQAAHQELIDWAGFNVPEGAQEEKGVKYVYQMWVRKESARTDTN
ncbi:hypothetical protein M408DRAFT_26222 [Serendipita vermifera MAFF 305830]|uniref:Dihydrofolate reductase n=1 Tax=Serendipita vermifera MAFF 305830 TaxID=933852 RepID=A0A0C2WG94_SERVB|nr:hypothetical protein M408DRAFT_26222 [Serendipita vermifera MAFF 305830]